VPHPFTALTLLETMLHVVSQRANVHNTVAQTVRSLPQMPELVLQSLAQMLSAVEHQPSALVMVAVLPHTFSRAVPKRWIAQLLANALTLLQTMTSVASQRVNALHPSTLARNRL
jgi:hypothetical protein